MGGNESVNSHNCDQLKYLCRGELIKVVKLNENKYYIYSGNKGKLYPLNDRTKDYFSYPETPGEIATVTFAEACGDSYCYKITVDKWIDEIGANACIDYYNKKVLQTLLPGDIVKFRKHHALYIGNERVIHLVDLKSRYGELTDRRREELQEFPNAQALVTTDKIKKLSQNVRILKANRLYLHGYDADEIIRRAKSQLGPAGYDWWYQNSKHFAEEMKYGEQVNRVRRSYTIGSSPYEWMSPQRPNNETETRNENENNI